jgi:hypothetical protein
MPDMGERGISRLYKPRVRLSCTLWGHADDEGIDLTGKIALVKYGGNFRGLKIKGELTRTTVIYGLKLTGQRHKKLELLDA